MPESLSHNELDLLQRISKGDENAFSCLVNQYSDLLGNYIFGLTHSREQAEEIVQDVFLKIWMTRESLSQVKNFRVWLYVVSKNQSLNALRKTIRDRIKRQEWQEDIAFANTEHTDDWKEQQLGLIDQAITLLPPQQKRAYLLSRKNGLKYKEIGQEMNLSPQTVKKYIQIAVHSITKYIESNLELSLFLLLFLKKLK
ncbi:RNA polymerase sigma factor [Arachidicoccus sp.]|uniref:RNA polymerase sigma factor n=1 Tax=Arachidicoccus sp. TaxID=1872624 RepID=UPI003D1C303B